VINNKSDHMQEKRASRYSIGLGTWKSKNGETREIVKEAIRANVLRIDCAPVYSNMEDVGAGIEQGLRESNVSRADLVVTSKLMTYELSPEGFEDEVMRQMRELRVEYIDLLLLQWPVVTKATIREQWRAMEALVEKNLVKQIGVANVSVKKLQDLLTYAKITPQVNQVECGPHFRQDNLVKFCKENDIEVQCYGPLGSNDQFSNENGGLGRKRTGPSPLENEVILELANKYRATPAQICLNWAVYHRKTTPLPKTVNKQRLEENIAALRLDIPDEELAKIDSIKEQYRLQHGSFHTGPGKCFATLEDLWDEDVSYMEGRDFEKPDGFRLR